MKTNEPKNNIPIIKYRQDIRLKLNPKYLQSENPYPEDSLEYHCYIDCCVHSRDGVISVAGLMHEFDQPFEYYSEGLPKLIQDGWLEIIEGGFE